MLLVLPDETIPHGAVGCSGPEKARILFSPPPRDRPFSILYLSQAGLTTPQETHLSYGSTLAFQCMPGSIAQACKYAHCCRLVQESRVPCMSAHWLELRAQVLDRLGYLRGVFESWGAKDMHADLSAICTAKICQFRLALICP